MIASSLPFTPWMAVPIAAVVGIGAGYAAGAVMRLAIRVFGHEGYVAETYEQKATRQYMEKAKQGMRD